MKKILFVLFAAVFTVFVAAVGCKTVQSQGNNDTQTDGTQNNSTQNNDTQTQISAVPVQEESGQSTDDVLESGSKHNLVVYFSRWGNTEYPDTVDVDATTAASILIKKDTRYGTTEYIANMIAEEVDGDLHRIETVTPYTTDFNELRDINHKEMAQNYLPELKESDLDISGYDTVFIGYPVWATDVPQAVISFLKEYDLSGKTVIPFCTHDGYGAGSSYSTIAKESHAEKTLDGLAIEASDVPSAQDTVTEWIASIGYSVSKETPIKIAIGELVLDGVLYDTELAKEIIAKLPLTVSMVGYGGREYYGGLDFMPEHISGGQLWFDNGDITYCSRNNTMAIFYAQTERPNLTMEVIPIGKVTSDLSVFDTLGSWEAITFFLAETSEIADKQEKPEESKVLVAYFSATNTTEGVAKKLADGIGADLYEIVPEAPYTNADLNYHDNKSRTTIEMNNPNARPAISGTVENMDNYDIIFLGYPIWWGEAPRIINTFMEAYDFSGKTIVPFCTSGGSGMGSSATNLSSITNGATWLSGRRFSGGISGDELMEWVKKLELDLSLD